MAKNGYVFLSKECFRKLLHDPSLSVKVRLLSYILINNSLSNRFIPITQTKLAEELELSRVSVCQHFNALVAEGMLESVIKHRQLYYRISPNMLAPAEERRKLSAG
jgi:biotin operon repressor